MSQCISPKQFQDGIIQLNYAWNMHADGGNKLEGGVQTSSSENDRAYTVPAE